MRVHFSDRFRNLGGLLDKMPERVQRKLKPIHAKNAGEFVRVFQEGVRNDDLGLRRLKVRTIARKAGAGFPQPETPLYGLGDLQKERSYINMFRTREVKNGFIVRPSIAKHWSGKLTLRQLYEIHESGAVVKRGKTMIRIPPRPAVARSYSRFLNGPFYAASKERMAKVIVDYFSSRRSR